MEILHYGAVLWRWKWLLALAAVLGAVATYWATINATPTYVSNTTLSVGQFLQSDTASGGDIATTQQLAQAYALTARRQDVLESVIRSLGLQTTPARLLAQVNAVAVPQTPLLRISVVDTDPRRAQRISSAIVDALIRQSPAGLQARQDEEQRRFIAEQVETTRSRIEDADAQIRELQERLARENSARAIQDISTQIAALQTRITALQSNYTRLLELARGSRTNFLIVVEPPSIGVPIPPAIVTNVAAAGLAGLLLAALAVIALDFFDDRIKSADLAQRALDLPVLGAIARVAAVKQPSLSLYALRQPRSWISETFRLLRSNLQWAGESAGTMPKQIVITSPSPGEGKTTIACNLAIALGQAGRRVILCDTDMRRPTVHRVFGVSNEQGLSTLLTDPSATLDALLVPGPVPGLLVLPAGPPPPNPGDLLGTETFVERTREMEDRADIVILDTPAVLAVADGPAVAPLAEATVLVIAAGKTRLAHARRAKEALEQAGARLTGLVINRSSQRKNSAYDYYEVARTPAERSLRLLGRAGQLMKAASDR